MVYSTIPKTLPEKIAARIAYMESHSIKIETKEDLAQALTDSGLNYVVESEERLNPRRENEQTGRFEIYRTDTGHLLGADRTERYEIIQNATALEPIFAFAATQTTPVYLSNANVYDNGSSISVSVDIGHMLIGDPKVGDVVLSRMTITTAHDGSGATRITITPYRVACMNGAIGWGNSSSAYVIRHTKTAEERIAAINATIAGVRYGMKQTEAVYQALATARMTRDQLIAAMDLVYPILGKEKQAAKNAKENRDQVIANFEDADGGFIDRETGWNGFNAFTHLTSHGSEVRIHDESRTPEQALALSKLSGAANKTDRASLKAVVTVLDMEDDIARILRSVESSQAATLATYAPQAMQTGSYDLFSLEVGA